MLLIHKHVQQINMWNYTVTYIVQIWLDGSKPGVIDVGKVLISGVLWHILWPIHHFTYIQDLGKSTCCMK